MEAARCRPPAISRIDKPEASPREVFSRSSNVSASRERRWAGYRRAAATPHESCYGTCRKRVRSHAASLRPSSDSKSHTYRSKKVLTYLTSYQHHLSEQTYIRWCCIDLSNAPRLPARCRAILFGEPLNHFLQIWITGPKAPREPVSATLGNPFAVRYHVELASLARCADRVNVQGAA